MTPAQQQTEARLAAQMGRHGAVIAPGAPCRCCSGSRYCRRSSGKRRELLPSRSDSAGEIFARGLLVIAMADDDELVTMPEPDFDLVAVDFDPFADDEAAKRASIFLRRLESLGGDKQALQPKQ
jgi:hypothetical protein